MGEQSLQSLAIQVFLDWVGGQPTKLTEDLHLQGCEMLGEAGIKDEEHCFCHDFVFKALL